VPQSAAMQSVESLYCDATQDSSCVLHMHLQIVTSIFGSCKQSLVHYNCLQKTQTFVFDW